MDEMLRSLLGFCFKILKVMVNMMERIVNFEIKDWMLGLKMYSLQRIIIKIYLTKFMYITAYDLIQT